MTCTLGKLKERYRNRISRNINRLVQSTTSTLGLLIFAKLNEALKKRFGNRVKAICTVYDSSEFEVPIEYAAEAIEMCFHYFNEVPQQLFPWLTLPIGCEGECGIAWGIAEVVHRGVTQTEIEKLIASMK